ncbi:hypothetical protein [Pantoea ananatis]|nr:hypothetical protein [Pantoea ananatis]
MNRTVFNDDDLDLFDVPGAAASLSSQQQAVAESTGTARHRHSEA